MSLSLREDLRPLTALTALMGGPRIWWGLVASASVALSLTFIGANLHMHWLGSGHFSSGKYSGLLALTGLLAIPAMVAKVAGDLDREISWRAMGAMLPGRERRFAKAYWILAFLSVFVSVVIFHSVWALFDLSLHGELGGAPFWAASLAIAAVGFVSGLWFRQRAFGGGRFLLQQPVLFALGYAVRSFCILATEQVWVAGAVLGLALYAMMLRTRPMPPLLENCRRGPTSLGLLAGEEAYVPEVTNAKFSDELAPEVTGGSFWGWIRAQRYALRTTASGLWSLKLAIIAGLFFMVMHFTFFFTAWALGFKSDLRIEYVQSLLGAPVLDVYPTGRPPSSWMNTVFGVWTLLYAALASRPLFGKYFYPVARAQKARLVFYNTVRLGLTCFCSLTLIACGVGYGVRALGAPIEIPGVPAALEAGLILLALFPVLVASILRGGQLRVSIEYPNISPVLIMVWGVMLLEVLDRSTGTLHLPDFGMPQLGIGYVGVLCLTYGAFYMFARRHFRRANLILGT